MLDAAVAPALDSVETADSGDCTAPITFATFDTMSAPDGSMDEDEDDEG